MSPKPTAVDGFYKLPEKFARDVIETNFSQNSLQQISNHIGYFLGVLMPIKVNFVEEPTDPRWVVSGSGEISKSEDGSPVSGLYRVMGYDHGEILLIKKNRYQLKHVLAILAHEYTHHYLHQYGARKESENENEILTEIATAYLGLGQFLINGYKPITWTSDYYNYIFVSGHTTHTMNLGYVTRSAIKKAIILAAELRGWDPEEVVSSFSSIFDKMIVYFKLWPYRSQVKRVKKEKEAITNLKRELETIRENYKNICLEFGKISKAANSLSISGEDNFKFVELANEISVGNIKGKIKNLLDNCEDATKFSNTKKESAQLATWIAKWQALLGKYNH